MFKGELVKVYYEGFEDCIKIIERGVESGLSLEASLECAKSAYFKTREQVSVA